MLKRLGYLAGALLLLAGCAASGTVTRVVPPALDPCAAGFTGETGLVGDNPFTWTCEAPPSAQAGRSRATRWVQASAEYAALTREAYRAAERRLADLRPRRGAFIIMDADETILDNAAYQAAREACGLSYTPQSWCDWSRAETGGLVPGAEAFIRAARAMGLGIVIITNRCEGERAWTETRLTDAKGEVLYDLLLMRGPLPLSLDGPPQPLCDGPSDKTGRFQAAADRLKGAPADSGRRAPRTLTPVMWIGDQIGDFPRFDARGRIVGVLTGEDRASLLAKSLRSFERRGTAFVLIPNPMYGVWDRVR